MSTILYIEDNDQNFYLVNFILTAKGHEVTRADNGQAGIEMAGRLTPELILLDIQLPIMDGYAVARALRSNAGLQRVPIVALTSYAMPGDREKAIDAGCSGYLEKPINPTTFAEQIQVFLKQSTSKGSLP